MASSFKRNPRWVQQVRESPEMTHARRVAAEQIAREASRVGGQVAHSYKAEVNDEGTLMRVEANTDGINAASWIEFGTRSLPAHSPLRRAVDATGLRTGKR